MGYYKGSGAKSPVAAPSGERKPHRKADFVVTLGWGQEWVHCPLCLARDDGHYPNGNPKYSGGMLDIDEDGDIVTVRCICGFGADDIGRLVTRDDKIVSLIAAVLWRRGDHTKPPEPVEMQNADEYARRIAKGFGQFMSGDITIDEYNEAEATLAAKLMPPKHLVPSASDVLADDALFARYRPCRMDLPTSSSKQVDGWRDGRAAANPDS